MVGFVFIFLKEFLLISAGFILKILTILKGSLNIFIAFLAFLSPGFELIPVILPGNISFIL